MTKDEATKILDRAVSAMADALDSSGRDAAWLAACAHAVQQARMLVADARPGKEMVTWPDGRGGTVSVPRSVPVEPGDFVHPSLRSGRKPAVGKKNGAKPEPPIDL